ncbi:MAG: aspartate aminotransferase family protein [Clostridia bacterium]|jgi:putrescine aminotransferase|nr:aspartate aminotransferase family protein [Clostridia bacterium]MDH7574005.1 aspartate aminotransferase family protein [Clostridia bacterium]
MFTLDEALEFDRATVGKLYKEYVNPGLAAVLGLLDFDKRFVRAEGPCLWDAEGNRYLDCLGAYGALNLGHNPPQVLAALEKVKQRPNLLQASLNPLAAALAHNLAEVAPGNLRHCFFCNSGAEAVEGALKLARAATGRTGLIYCEGSFHGKTLGALSVTGRDKYQRPFEPLVPDCRCIPYGDAAALEQALKERPAAAFIVEPIQGEGGIVVPPPGYLTRARELTSRHGVLLIVDEIQTGLGRTGNLFACQHEQVAPDILCLAKSLGGGIMPVGAFITTPELWQRAYGGMDKCLLHTSTFGGNTWAMAAGLAALKTLVEENLAEEARKKGEFLRQRLAERVETHPLVKAVRGRGLMIGIEFVGKEQGLLDRLTGGMTARLREEYTASLVAGLLLNEYHILTAYTLNNPNVIRLEPPLTITYEDLDRVVGALEAILGEHGSFGSLALASSRTLLKSLFRKE